MIGRMNLDLLHTRCKVSTRNAFEEYKRQIDVRLFPFNDCLNDNLKAQMFQDLGMPVVKYFLNNYNLSSEQLKVLNDTINSYELIAQKSADNYSKRFYDLI
jgi:hypothetical protein